MRNLAFCAITLGFALLLTSFTAAAEDNPTDTLKLRDVEVTFHRAGSVLPEKDLNLMMSSYADDAVLIDTAHQNKTYAGKEQVRAYFEDIAAPFRPENHYIGYTPAMRIRTKVNGKEGTLYFECLWMDVDKNNIGVHAFSDMTLTKSGDKWLIKTIKVGKVEKL